MTSPLRPSQIYMTNLLDHIAAIPVHVEKVNSFISGKGAPTKLGEAIHVPAHLFGPTEEVRESVKDRFIVAGWGVDEYGDIFILRPREL